MKSVIFTGIFAFIISLIYFIPLPFAAQHLLAGNNNIVIEEPSGTIWSGNINHLTVNKHYLGKVNWSLAPIKSLMALSLKANFTIKSDDLDISGVAGIGLGKEIIIDETQFNINSRYVNTLQKNVKLTGDFNGFIKHALIQKNIVPTINGDINWVAGTVDTPFIKLDKGNYKALLAPVSDNLNITLSSDNAPIDLGGDINLQNDWVYSTNITMKSQNKGLITATRLGLTSQTKGKGKVSNNKDGSLLIQVKDDLKPFIGLN